MLGLASREFVGKEYYLLLWYTDETYGPIPSARIITEMDLDLAIKRVRKYAENEGMAEPSYRIDHLSPEEWNRFKNETWPQLLNHWKQIKGK